MIRKLLSLVIILTLSAAAGFSAHKYVYDFQRKEIVDQAFAWLNLFLGLRKTALEDHFKSSGSDVKAMGRNPIIMKAMLDLESAWIAQGLDVGDELRRQYITENPNPAGERSKFNAVPDGSDYSRARARLQP